MQLNESNVQAWYDILTDPVNFGVKNLRPLSEIFEESDIAIAKHKVFEQYIDIVNANIPKIFFYLVMDKIYKSGKSLDGNIGYLVKIKS